MTASLLPAISKDSFLLLETYCGLLRMASAFVADALTADCYKERRTIGKKMKITAIRTFIARFGNRPRGLIKIETDEGLSGWGEAYSTGPDLSVEPIADYIFEMIQGEDPRRIEYIMMKLHQQFRFPAGGPDLPSFRLLIMPFGTSVVRQQACRFICSSVGTPETVSVSTAASAVGTALKPPTKRINSMKSGGSLRSKTSPYQLDPDANRWGRVCDAAAAYFEQIRENTPTELGVCLRSARQDL